MRIAVLAGLPSKEGLGLGIHTEQRCKKVWYLLLQQIISGELQQEIFIFLAHGKSESWKKEETLAVVMEKYLSVKIQDLSEQFPNISLPSIRLVVNRNDPQVCNTFLEMQWVLKQIRSETASTFVVTFVTNKAHSHLVRIMNRVFFPEFQINFLYSSDKPLGLWHEVLSYSKLVFLLSTHYWYRRAK